MSPFLAATILVLLPMVGAFAVLLLSDWLRDTRRWIGGQGPLPTLTTGELAMLSGGDDHAVLTAAAALVRRGAVALPGEARLALPEAGYRGEPASAPGSAFEARVHGFITGEDPRSGGAHRTLADLHRSSRELIELERVDARLVVRGLLASRDRVTRARRVGAGMAAVMVMLPLVLAPIVVTGWGLDAMEVVIFVLPSWLLALFAAVRRANFTRLTARGVAELERLRAEQRPAYRKLLRAPRPLPPEQLTHAVALYGADALGELQPGLLSERRPPLRQHVDALLAPIHAALMRGFVHRDWTPALAAEAARMDPEGVHLRWLWHLGLGLFFAMFAVLGGIWGELGIFGQGLLMVLVCGYSLHGETKSQRELFASLFEPRERALPPREGDDAVPDASGSG